MNRRRARGHSRHALFDWTATGDIQAAEIHANPLAVPCRHEACHAGRWQPCTNRGRRCDPHPTRRADADTAHAQQPTETTPSTPPQPRTEPTR